VGVAVGYQKIAGLQKLVRLNVQEELNTQNGLGIAHIVEQNIIS